MIRSFGKVQVIKLILENHHSQQPWNHLLCHSEGLQIRQARCVERDGEKPIESSFCPVESKEHKRALSCIIWFAIMLHRPLTYFRSLRFVLRFALCAALCALWDVASKLRHLDARTISQLAARSSSHNHAIDLEQDSHDARVRSTQIYASKPTLLVHLTLVFQDHNPKSPEVNVWVKHHRSCCKNICRDHARHIAGTHETSHKAWKHVLSGNGWFSLAVQAYRVRYTQKDETPDE
jgi:hypothetical protein